jgi:transcriptional regulator with XRE-family HTH domain
MQKALLALGKRMRNLREKQGFSQEAFADHCGLHRTAISLIERGKRVPSLTTLLTISSGFGISLSELLRDVDSVYRRKPMRFRHI